MLLGFLHIVVSMFALIGLLEFVLRDSCIGFKQALLYRNFCVRNIGRVAPEVKSRLYEK